MNLKNIFSTVEGIAVLAGFGLVILTGTKMSPINEVIVEMLIGFKAT